MKLRNAYIVRPDDVKPGDIYAFTITCHVTNDGTLRFYRCPYPNTSDLYDDDGVAIPQGQRLPNDATVRDIFPSMFIAQKLNSLLDNQ